MSLFKKLKIAFPAVYKRDKRAKYGHGCCLDSRCNFYCHNSHLFSCEQIEFNFKGMETTGLHLCSYLNYKESHYIYALQETI